MLSLWGINQYFIVWGISAESYMAMLIKMMEQKGIAYMQDSTHPLILHCQDTKIIISRIFAYNDGPEGSSAEIVIERNNAVITQIIKDAMLSIDSEKINKIMRDRLIGLGFLVALSAILCGLSWILFL